MRQAMASAEVGDDVFGEDPTVLRLQERVADLLGKEAALFVPSGSMANQLAVRVQTQPGDEVICEAACHIVNYESAAAPVLSGVQLLPIHGDRGRLSPEQVSAAVRHAYYWEPQSRLVCLENTANKAGGTVLDQDEVVAVGEVVRSRGLAFHLDGARLWNAAVASGLSEKELAAPFDTVSVCLSKGLGAPIGSLLAGPAEVVTKAHRWRKVLGGGMRQVGILAAAGLHALEHHRSDLAADHARARRLASGLASCGSVTIDPDSVETNIVMFDVEGFTALEALERLREAGVLMVPFGPQRIRATTHRDLGDADIEAALAACGRVLG
ncbi:MAG: low specificity L-threonine aldolase [Rhodothermales bacterium]|nr:low specificity L-threonine aldolase [Rhodothermales bacterium]